MKELKKLSVDYSVNLFFLTEVNKDWWDVPQEHTIWNRTMGWRENRRVKVSNNITKSVG